MADTSPGSLRRTRIDQNLIDSGAVVIDQLRERTRWSDGMFVTSQHFNRDQSYLITRAGDLGQAIGTGVIEGLEVTAPADDPSALLVGAGIGIAGGGDSIVVHKPVRIALGDIALQKSLGRLTRIEESLQLTAESRSGLFVLCATPVEYSSNPIGSYTTTPAGRRRLEDGVTNEATLFTLVPYALSGSTRSSEARRALAAKRIFIDGKPADIPSTSLPLAMIEVEGNVLLWLDADLVRRDAGAARADVFGLGFVDTPARIAHFRQYDEMITGMVAADPSLAFAAADRFDALPPMGQMPAACIAARAPAPGLDPVLSQNWLPAEMPVELVALPEDEIAQLLEESLTLPPIDLGAKPEALAQTPVSILIPIPRIDWPNAPTELVQQALTLKAAQPLGAPPQSPTAMIRSLIAQERDADQIDPTVNAAWQALLAGQSLLWYARRRQILRTDALIGEASPFLTAPDDGGPVTPPPPVEDSAPIIDGFDDVIRRALSPFGMVSAFDRLTPDNTADQRPVKSELNAALGQAIGGGSALAAADILHRFREDADPDALRELRAIYAEPDVILAISTQEGLLLGGVLDVVIPPFVGRASETEVNGNLARAVNFGTSPEPGEQLELPDDFANRISPLVQERTFSGEEAASILSRGGGLFNLEAPRDADTLRSFMAASLDLEAPLIWRVRDPGGIEAQTRRNLVAGTLQVSSIAKALSEVQLIRFPDAVINLMQVLDEVMTANTGDARDRVSEAVGELMAEIGL